MNFHDPEVRHDVHLLVRCGVLDALASSTRHEQNTYYRVLIRECGAANALRTPARARPATLQKGWT
jgi:hypothetical protein